MPDMPVFPPPKISETAIFPDKIPCYSADGSVYYEKSVKVMKSALSNGNSLMDESKSPLEALIGFKKLAWNFNDNDRVWTYRTRAANSNFRDVLPDAIYWRFPRYLTTVPFPMNAFPVEVVVTLPVGASTNKYATVSINENDTPATLLAKVLLRCTEKKYANSALFMFKVIGSAEYIYGREHIIEFEYVRAQLREKSQIRFRLEYIEDMREQISSLQEELDSMMLLRPYPDAIFEGSIPELEYNEVKYDFASSLDKLPFIPSTRIDVPFRCEVLGIDNVEFFPRLNLGISSIFVRFQLVYGTQKLSNSLQDSRTVPVSNSDCKFYEWISLLNITVNKLQWGTKASFCIYGIADHDGKEVLLGYVTPVLFDQRNILLNGIQSFPLWIVPASKSNLDELYFIGRGTTTDNLSSKRVPTLHIRFDTFLKPVIGVPVTKLQDVIEPTNAHQALSPSSRSKKDKGIMEVVDRDLLATLSQEEQTIMWENRRNYMDRPDVLPKVLKIVDWNNPVMSNEARCLMHDWASFSHPFDALILLDANYPDPMVRSFAVHVLNKLSDSELAQVLIQLVQCLKYEPHHRSTLAQFLIQRAIRNPYQIGHFFFWHMKAELHNIDFCERYAVIIEEYLVENPKHAKELQIQDAVVGRLLEIADLITQYSRVEKRDKANCKAELRKELAGLNEVFPRNFQIPLNPKWRASSINVEECKYMSSKKVPLWLSFTNVDKDGDPMLVIFKSGDDLRQDLLTLQLIRIMDKIWLNSNLDLKMKPYSCVATGVNPDGEGVGMLEIVVKSDTISRIQIEEGGGFTGALQLNPLKNYIQKYNQGSQFEIAVDNFVRSCAGYCVATFVLGVGDRHNDNIMLSESGHLFRKPPLSASPNIT